MSSSVYSDCCGDSRCDDNLDPLSLSRLIQTEGQQTTVDPPPKKRQYSTKEGRSVKSVILSIRTSSGLMAVYTLLWQTSEMNVFLIADKANVLTNLFTKQMRSFILIAMLTRCVVLHPVDVLRAGSLYNPPSAAPRPAGSNLVGCGIAIKTWVRKERFF